MTAPRLILASGSPRRAEILKALGFRFEVIPAELDEQVDPRLGAEENAMFLARAKALAVANRHPEAVILGSDTLVAVDDEILGKPESPGHAKAILRRLSGTRHRVISAVSVSHRGSGSLRTEHAVTWLKMDVMPASEIDRYVDSGASFGKAGAYAYQEGGDRFLQIEEGDVDTVVGLPGRLTVDLLAGFGVCPG